MSEKVSQAMIPQTVKQYAKEDITEAIKKAKKLGTNLKLDTIKFDAYRAGDDENSFSVDAQCKIKTADGKTFEFPIEYVIEGDDVYLGAESMDDLAQSLVDRSKDSITAATRPRGKKRIVADEEIQIADTLDDIADSVNDMQDSVEDITEDDPDIEVENDITNHYICQCDVCNGIFVSALMETDQEVDSVSGICPNCGKESEQFIKWIVRELDYVPSVAPNQVSDEELEEKEEEAFKPEEEAPNNDSTNTEFD